MKPLIDKCLSADPAERPKIASIIGTFNTIVYTDNYLKNGQGLIQRILQKLVAYAEKLDHLVVERTLALEDEMRKCDNLLREMLPRYERHHYGQIYHVPLKTLFLNRNFLLSSISTIVEDLRRKNTVVPRSFDLVTILFR